MPVVGDAIHNLRAALSYAFFSVLPINVDSKQFPVRDTREKFIWAMKGGLKKRGAPNVLLETIVDRIQPYKGGNGDALWCLHRLNIADKHRLLIAKTQLTFTTGNTPENETGKEMLVDDWLLVEGKVASYSLFGNQSLDVTSNRETESRISGLGLSMA